MKGRVSYLALLTIAPFLYSASPIFSQNLFAQDIIKKQSQLETGVKSNNIVIAKQIPHYLKDLKPISELKNLDEIEKEIAKTSAIARTTLTKSLSAEYDSHLFSNGSEEEQMELYGHKVRLVFHEYIREGNKVIHYNPTGQETLTLDEFEVVKQDLRDQLKKSVDLVIKTYKPVAEKVKKNLEEKLQIDDLDSIANKEIPGYGITYGDVLGKIDLQPGTCVPNELHLGFTPGMGILGMSILNSKMVLYSPLGRAHDYVLGSPLILAHEINHNCIPLQNFVSGFDKEFQASLMDIIAEEGEVFNYLLHPYGKTLRGLEKRYFSFDSEKMFLKITKFGRGSNIEIVEDKLREEFKLMKKIRGELRRTLPDFFAEFYTNKYFWTAVNEKFQDKNAWLDILMAQKYEPTIYTEPGKKNQGAVEDIRFLKELNESGIIEDIRNEAWNNMKQRGKPEEILNESQKETAKRIMKLSKLYHVDDVTMQQLQEKFDGKDFDKLEKMLNKIYESFVK